MLLFNYFDRQVEIVSGFLNPPHLGVKVDREFSVMQAGRKYVVDCTSHGDSNMKISWSKNGIKLPRGKQVTGGIYAKGMMTTGRFRCLCIVYSRKRLSLCMIFHSWCASKYLNTENPCRDYSILSRVEL